MSAGELGGFPVTVAVDRSLGKTQVSIRLDGAPGARIAFPAPELHRTDPAGLVTRLENRLSRLEDRETSALADIEHARREIAHARDSIGKPFPRAAELAAAQDRVREIDRALQRMAAPGQDTDAAGGTPGSPEAGDGRNDAAATDSRPQASNPYSRGNTQPAVQSGERAVTQSAGAQPSPATPSDPAGTPARQASAGTTAHAGAAAPPVSLAPRAVPGAHGQAPPPRALATPARAGDPRAPQPADSPGIRNPEHREPFPGRRGDSQAMQANRAAVAANEACRAGDLDRAARVLRLVRRNIWCIAEDQILCTAWLAIQARMKIG